MLYNTNVHFILFGFYFQYLYHQLILQWLFARRSIIHSIFTTSSELCYLLSKSWPFLHGYLIASLFSPETKERTAKVFAFYDNWPWEL